jgi:hypothetical protein
MIASDHRSKAQQKSNVTSFIETPPIVNLDDADMEAFYAILDYETSILSLYNDIDVISESSNRIIRSEETKKALKTLQDFLTKDFYRNEGKKIEYTKAKVEK